MQSPTHEKMLKVITWPRILRLLTISAKPGAYIAVTIALHGDDKDFL